MKYYYYQVIGKNKHIPINYFTKACNMAEARQKFYLFAGSDIKYVLRVNKSQYDKYNI